MPLKTVLPLLHKGEAQLKHFSCQLSCYRRKVFPQSLGSQLAGESGQRVAEISTGLKSCRCLTLPPHWWWEGQSCVLGSRDSKGVSWCFQGKGKTRQTLKLEYKIQTLLALHCSISLLSGVWELWIPMKKGFFVESVDCEEERFGQGGILCTSSQWVAIVPVMNEWDCLKDHW